MFLLKSKPLLTIILLGIVIHLLNAQSLTPVKVWDVIPYTQSTISNAYANRIIPMSDGGVVIVGTLQVGSAATDPHIMRVSASGTKMWDTHIGLTTTYLEEFFDVTTTDDGNLMAVGYVVINGTGATDYYFVKINATTGAVMFSNSNITANDNDYCTSIVPSGDGNFIVGGYSNSELNGSKTNVNFEFPNGADGGTSDFWLMKINASTGAKMTWGSGTDKTYGGSNHDVLSRILKVSDGYLLVGYSKSTASTGNKTAANKGLEDYWVVKIDTDGVVQWDKSFGTTLGDFAVGIAAVTGGYVIGGYTKSGINQDKSQANKAGTTTTNDYWVVKIDANGNKLWDKTYGTNLDDIAFDIASTSDGGFVVSGGSSGRINGDKTEDRKSGTTVAKDYWILKADSDGVIQWDKTLGGTAEDKDAVVTETTDGGYVAAGFSYSTQNSGDKTIDTNGSSIYDDWVIKISVPSFSASATNVTCNGTVPNSNGKLNIVTAAGITKYGYSTGSVYTGPNYTSATTASTAPYSLVSTLTNPTVNQPYTIRGFINSTSYVDRVVTLSPVICNNADLGVSISPTIRTGNKNDILSHTITVSNAGPQPSSDVIVQVTLPNTVTYLSSSAQQGTYDPNTKLWSVGTVTSGSNITLTVNYKNN